MARDLAATRAGILDAAEALFADRGYDGASMQDIATAARVSRGMPGYAFGSKQRLYEAVLVRAFAGPRDLAAQLATQPPSGDPKQLLRSVIEGYIDFLVDRPTYVRLMERAALDGSSRFGQSQAHLEALGEALGGADSLFASGAFANVDPRHLFVDVVALCLFPLAHRQTLLAPLGFDAEDPAFIADRKAHVVDLVLHGLLGADSTGG